MQSSWLSSLLRRGSPSGDVAKPVDVSDAHAVASAARSKAHRDALDVLHAAASADEAKQVDRALALYSEGTERLLAVIKEETDLG